MHHAARNTVWCYPEMAADSWRNIIATALKIVRLAQKNTNDSSEAYVSACVAMTMLQGAYIVDSIRQAGKVN